VKVVLLMVGLSTTQNSVNFEAEVFPKLHFWLSRPWGSGIAYTSDSGTTVTVTVCNISLRQQHSLHIRVRYYSNYYSLQHQTQVLQ